MQDESPAAAALLNTSTSKSWCVSMQHMHASSNADDRHPLILLLLCSGVPLQHCRPCKRVQYKPEAHKHNLSLLRLFLPAACSWYLSLEVGQPLHACRSRRSSTSSSMGALKDGLATWRYSGSIVQRNTRDTDIPESEGSFVSLPATPAITPEIECLLIVSALPPSETMMPSTQA